MQHVEKGNFAVVGFFLDTDENIQKIIKKTIRIFNCFSIVKFDRFDQST